MALLIVKPPWLMIGNESFMVTELALTQENIWQRQQHILSRLWAWFGPSTAEAAVSVNEQALIEQLPSTLRLPASPGKYSYHLVDMTTLETFHAGGAIWHNFGVSNQEFLQHTFAELVSRYVHPDDQIAYMEFVEQALSASVEPTQQQQAIWTFYYRQLTADGRTLQVMQQGQPMAITPQGLPTVKLEIIVDLSHIRAVDAPPMLTLLDLNDLNAPLWISPQADTGLTHKMASPLSSRELGILQLLAEGKTSKQIAYALQISPNTVNNHRKRIMEKLHAQSTTEAVSIAIQQGYLSQPVSE